LYSCGGKTYPPERDTGPAPECRIEVSPSSGAATDCFLHVLTATDAGTISVPAATAKMGDREVAIIVGPARITFRKEAVGGDILMPGTHRPFIDRVARGR
jgi:hypothetical protein